MFIVKYYLMTSLAFAIAAFYSSFLLVKIGFIWLAVSLFLVCVGYILDKPGLFRKRRDGRIPLYIQWLFLPFLMGAQAYNWWARRNDSVPAIQKIDDDLFLACRLTSSDLPSLQADGVNAILDATAEFSGLNISSDELNFNYLNVPILDHKSPHEEDLIHAVNWIRNQIKNGNKVVVHCALGRGRSVFIMAAFLVASGRAENVEKALSRINSIRGTAKLNSFQYKLLSKVAKSGALSLKRGLLLIVNPVSGKGTWSTSREEIEQLLAPTFDLEIALTTEKISATELIGQYKLATFDMVVACGGDGTINEVAANLVGTDIPLGIIPLGTTNALAHVLLGAHIKVIPVSAACDVILAGTTKLLDTAKCNNDLMLLVAGIGFEEQMIANADRESKREYGELAYLKALQAAVEENRGENYTLAINGNAPRSVKATSIVVSNAAPFTTVLAQGNGTPDPFDGKLDLTIIEADCDSIKAIAALSMQSLSKILDDDTRIDGVEHQCIESITIESESDKPLRYVIDGETKQADSLQISLQPKSLNILCS